MPSHRYPLEKRDALSNISFTIERGDRIFLFGLNGAGKTTTLNLLGLLETLRNGRILYYDTKDKEWNYREISRAESQRIRKNFSFLIQDPQLLHYFSGWENVMQSLILQGISPHDAWNSCEKVLEELFKNEENGKELVIKNSPEVSGGQRQKFALARAIIRKADIFFVDEIRTCLDIKNAATVIQYFKKYLDERQNTDNPATLILVSHNYQDAFDLGVTRFFHLHDGVLDELTATSADALYALQQSYTKRSL